MGGISQHCRASQIRAARTYWEYLNIFHHLGRLGNPNPIKSKGADYAHQISMSQPISFTFRRPCSQMNGYLLTSFDFDSLGSSD